MRKMLLQTTLVLASASLILAQKPKSNKEIEALQAIQTAQDPDARIAAIENLLTKFADTEFKPMVLTMAAQTEQQKGDYEKMVIYCDRALEADPKSYTAMLMLASGGANHTREFDLDKEEKLAKAEKNAKTALELIPSATKPNPAISDDQWAIMKKDFTSQGHEALGLVAVARKNYEGAIAEFKTSVEMAGTPDPATAVRLGSAYNSAGKYDEAIATLDKVINIPDVNPAVKQFAQNEKAKAVKAKSGTAAPAAKP